MNTTAQALQTLSEHQARILQFQTDVEQLRQQVADLTAAVNELLQKAAVAPAPAKKRKLAD